MGKIVRGTYFLGLNIIWKLLPWVLSILLYSPMSITMPRYEGNTCHLWGFPSHSLCEKYYETTNFLVNTISLSVWALCPEKKKIDLSSWKSQPIIIKFWTYCHKILDLSSWKFRPLISNISTINNKFRPFMIYFDRSFRDHHQDSLLALTEFKRTN